MRDSNPIIWTVREAIAEVSNVIGLWWTFFAPNYLRVSACAAITGLDSGLKHCFRMMQMVKFYIAALEPAANE